MKLTRVGLLSPGLALCLALGVLVALARGQTPSESELAAPASEPSGSSTAMPEEAPARDAQESTGGGDEPEVEDQAGQEQIEQQSSGGLISMILSPIRATFERAKRMLASRLGGARDLVVSGFDEVQTRTFRMFMRAYNKSYSASELPRRMGLFFERRKLIEQSVREFAQGSLPFAMRENTFADWDEEELRQLARASPPASLDEMTEEERAAVLALEQQRGELGELERGADGEGEFIEWTTTGDPSEDEQEEKESEKENEIDTPGEERMGVARARGSPESEPQRRNLTVRATERIPAAKDWRTSGCVATPINQMKCGACYAIATVGVVESMRCINRVSSSPILSPQQVVDCSRAYKNFGCDGGWPTRVLKYLQDTRVLARESCYPFVRRQNSCKLRSVQSQSGCTVKASPTDGQQLSYKVLNNERDILYHVAKTGPVVTVMRATDPFLYYGKGIFDDPKCTRKRDDVDHAISIVGYGRENNMDYWLIKNSWGTKDWGLDGYGKYRRGTNACSIGHWGWVITG